VDVAIALVAIGLLIGGLARGQELIQNARVRDFMARQDAVEQAVSRTDSKRCQATTPKQARISVVGLADA